MKSLRLTISLVVLLASQAAGQLISSNNNVSIVGALPAGTALLGKMGIDQTTPGTTNGVALAQIGSTTIDSNSGNKSAGTMRVVLATDQPALTSHLLVTPDANSAVNIAQINGVTPLVGAGNGGTGSWRVNIASDQVSIPVTVNNTTCVGTAKSKAWIAVPISSTAVTTTTACLLALTFTNTNSSTQTVTVTDGQGSPITIVGTFVVPANSTVTFPFYGEASTTGFKWVAGGSGVTGGATWLE
jgi:hypothetical protein